MFRKLNAFGVSTAIKGTVWKRDGNGCNIHTVCVHCHAYIPNNEHFLRSGESNLEKVRIIFGIQSQDFIEIAFDTVSLLRLSWFDFWFVLKKETTSTWRLMRQRRQDIHYTC